MARSLDTRGAPFSHALMERTLPDDEVDQTFADWWSKLGQRLETIPLALQETLGELGARVSAAYVPPPQREAAPQAPPSDARKDMLALCAKWYGTSLKYPVKPAGEAQDLLSLAGWSVKKGEDYKKVKDAGGTTDTSCGDVLAAVLRLWGSGFVGAFNIRDQGLKENGGPLPAPGQVRPGAKKLGYYVEATGTNTPKLGDIIVLRRGVGRQFIGSVGHVGVLVSIGTDAKGVPVWRTADGGGGLLPDQVAAITPRTIKMGDDGIPTMKSPTDGEFKQLDGWIDLDRLPRKPQPAADAPRAPAPPPAAAAP
jgi:hypothetical protein